MDKEALEELRGVGNAFEVLVKNPKDFENLVKAVKERRFEVAIQTLEHLRLYRYCWLIITIICQWESFPLCRLYCDKIPYKPPQFKDYLDFSNVIVTLHKDEKLITEVFDAFKGADPKRWALSVEKLKWGPGCVLLCRWVEMWVCRLELRAICQYF